MRRLKALQFGLGCVSVFLVASAQSAIIGPAPLPGRPAVIDTPTDFLGRWSWGMVAGAEGSAWFAPVPPPPPPAPPPPVWAPTPGTTHGNAGGVGPGQPNAAPITNWFINPSSGAAAGAIKTLAIDLQHRVAPHAGDVAPNPLTPVQINPAATVTPGVASAHAGIFQLQHPAAHKDVYAWRVVTPAGPGAATLDVRAQHQSKAFSPAWSFTPYSAIGLEGRLTVIGSYSDGSTHTFYDNAKVKWKPGEPGNPPQWVSGPRDGSLARKGKTPTDVTIRWEKGDPVSTETTLAFVEGTPGTYQHADLGAFTHLFFGLDEYLVPALFDPNELIDLYVGVDLAQWLSFGDPFSPGDLIDIVDGYSDLLPGMVSPNE
jgi:hypothetical protein